MKWHPIRKRVKHIDEEGLEHISRWEGVVLRAYRDVAGVWTIGVGHTGSDVYEGQQITHREAMELLRKDVAVAEEAVRTRVKRRLNQDQFNSLVSLVFNIGTGAFADSTLLERINRRESPARIRDAFLMWVWAGGTVSQGLINRREAEADLFNRRNA